MQFEAIGYTDTTADKIIPIQLIDCKNTNFFELVKLIANIIADYGTIFSGLFKSRVGRRSSRPGSRAANQLPGIAFNKGRDHASGTLDQSAHAPARKRILSSYAK